jgi:hypothetical protein
VLCEICNTAHPLHNLTRAGYEADDGRTAGSGRVCPTCLASLPAILRSRTSVWRLVMRAP